tara:strand:- start:72 stop:1376 length:1305 start_codon:yes stop_codon:yes gene_type:complete
MKVAKFGGSSLADSSAVLRVIDIIQSDPSRRVIVVSAPGKRNPDDIKITDQLSNWRTQIHLGHTGNEAMEAVYSRFFEIEKNLGVNIGIHTELLDIEERLKGGASYEYAVSRGEYLNGLLIAEALDFQFKDAADVIRVSNLEPVEHHVFTRPLKMVLKKNNLVIPGFYGQGEDSTIRTFSRGGSDITGALIASALNASEYENWTDVLGMKMVDPRIVPKAVGIPEITFQEMRELSYMGFEVFHEEAMFPVWKSNLPVHIRSTAEPNKLGTLITPNIDRAKRKYDIAGIAGKDGFTSLTFKKRLMNKEVGYVRKLLSVLERHQVSFEHIPGSIDTVSLIVESEKLTAKKDLILEEIDHECSPDSVTESQMAIISIVGIGIVRQVGIAAKIFSALSEAGVNIEMINQGSSELNVIIGVKESDLKKAIKAIYHTFVA